MDLADPKNAPVIFFDGAPAVAATPGLVRITLAGRLELMRSGEVVTEVVAAGHLRCTPEAAINLRDAIDSALLLAAPAATA